MGKCGSDNRTIQDDGTSQELTEGDIRTLKGEGMSGKVYLVPLFVMVCGEESPGSGELHLEQ